MTANDATTVLVTGANGYLGTHITAALLREGYRVRAAVRTPERGEELLRDLRRTDTGTTNELEIVRAELDSDTGWDEAMSGARFVLHVASPFPTGVPEHEDELIVPARDGLLRVLRAARDGGVERVVVTSSYAAIGYSRTDNAEFTEADWTDVNADLQPYIKSKVVAERAAWDFVEREGNGLELVVVNPVGIFGPALGPKLSTSVNFVKAMLDGALESVPNQHFGVVDVRDVADLHLRAMTVPEAVGQRFLAVADGPSVSFLGVAQLLHDEFGDIAARVPLVKSDQSSDGSDPTLIPAISNAKAKAALGWQPRPVRETLLDTVRSLVELELSDAPQ